MLFALIRDLFAYITTFTALALIAKIGIFSLDMQHTIVIVLPILFIAIHQIIVRKFKKEFDNQAYFSAIVGVAIFAALGSFSQPELIEFGFKVESIHSFFIFKLYFHIWAIVLLPVALKKFFKKN